jgi:integrin beta 2
MLLVTGLANQCLILNGGCEDQCNLNAAGEVFCQCFSGRTLMADGKRCTSKDADCNEQEFRCSSGGCVPYHLTCDGISNCEDNSDEDFRFCGIFICCKLLTDIISEKKTNRKIMDTSVALIYAQIN